MLVDDDVNVKILLKIEFSDKSKNIENNFEELEQCIINALSNNNSVIIASKIDIIDITDFHGIL